MHLREGSVGSQRVRHDQATEHTHTHTAPGREAGDEAGKKCDAELLRPLSLFGIRTLSLYYYYNKYS